MPGVFKETRVLQKISMDQDNFLNFWKGLSSRVDSHLNNFLQHQEGVPNRLLDAMRYSVLAPGKRLRPMLVLLTSDALGFENTNPWPAACAVEFIHAYSLIHDDLPAMDDDDLRRGRPTCHRVYGEALAILAGDALLTKAFEILAKSYPPLASAECCLELAKGAGAGGMVGGQVEDLAWEGKPGVRADDHPKTANINHLKTLHDKKTGALIRASLKLGAIVSFASQNQKPPEDLLQILDNYGQNIGLAFQVTDDLLDVLGKCESAGKRVGKDAQKGKLTYPGLLGIEQSKLLASDLCKDAQNLASQLGPNAAPLVDLAEYLVSRDH